MTGNVYIISIPSGADIFVNGSDQKTTTACTVANAPVGENTLTLRLENFNDYSETIVVPDGDTINIVANLVPSQGCAYFTTTPPGATISIDNQSQVNTNGDPLITPALICGATLNVQHTYRLILAGYLTTEDTFILGTDQGQTISTTLSTCPSISLVVNPMSGTIGDMLTLTTTINPTGIYTVDFKDGTTLLQTVQSGIDGIVTYNWDTTNAAEGIHNIIASIDQCSSSSIAVNLTTPTPIPTTIDILPTTVPTLNIGDTQQFVATVIDQFGNIMSNITVTWQSSDPTIGTIDSTGIFTTIKEGTVDITASIDTITSNTVQIVVAHISHPAPTHWALPSLLIGMVVVGAVMTSKKHKDNEKKMTIRNR